MSTDLSGSYAFNGVDLTLQPTTGKWKERTSYGVDGNGRPVYSSLRSFELKWDLISTSDAKQIIDSYTSTSITGTVVSCLPEWGNVEYTFQNYSGTTLQEPQVSEYFQGYVTSVSLLILHVRTN
jgi:hypothetical protein